MNRETEEKKPNNREISITYEVGVQIPTKICVDGDLLISILTYRYVGNLSEKSLVFLGAVASTSYKLQGGVGDYIVGEVSDGKYSPHLLRYVTISSAYDAFCELLTKIEKRGELDGNEI